MRRTDPNARLWHLTFKILKRVRWLESHLYNTHLRIFSPIEIFLHLTQVKKSLQAPVPLASLLSVKRAFSLGNPCNLLLHFP